ncbi:hypothetical protein K504DRAFT_466550 [Pleomassaria siparia CBS 279.74]|uniref:Uncharacterized protein n=1 Tax=Pleomassaria siparia CBS 279.74 TaxID=1314801 RepID=A0A6G1KBV7_9PLEO|nr:hypothetical protein K504DRAFT_466550 [Pleomassaria siparia CBS 279.74]
MWKLQSTSKDLIRMQAFTRSAGLSALRYAFRVSMSVLQIKHHHHYHHTAPHAVLVINRAGRKCPSCPPMPPPPWSEDAAP